MACVFGGLRVSGGWGPGLVEVVVLCQRDISVFAGYGDRVPFRLVRLDMRSFGV